MTSPTNGRRPGAKLTESQVREIKALLAARAGRLAAGGRITHGGGLSFAAIARRYGVSEVTIRSIDKGKIWAQLGDES